MKIADAKESDYTALVIPGGVMNPDKLRVDDDAMKLVKAFLASGKVVAAVCHGPWLLVQADALKGRQATSYPSIRKDVENAGAKWIDEKVVVDNGIITSRNPDDLPSLREKDHRGSGRRPSLSPRGLIPGVGRADRRVRSIHLIACRAQQVGHAVGPHQMRRTGGDQEGALLGSASSRSWAPRPCCGHPA